MINNILGGMTLKYDKSVSKESNLFKFIRSILFGSLFGAIMCAGLLMLFSFLFVTVKSVPQPMIQWLAIICAAVGAFVAGYASSKIHRSKGLMCGAASGLLLFLVVTLVAFIVSRDKFTYITIVRALAMIIPGALGGVLGVSRKRHK